jgi:DNA-directed RNA polymerase subunit E'/Rpb7
MAIHPSNFGIPSDEVLISEIIKKICELCLRCKTVYCVSDLSEAEEAKVRYGNGRLWYTVRKKTVSLK